MIRSYLYKKIENLMCTDKLLLATLRHFGISHTTRYVKDIAFENPHSENLFGVLRVLYFYGITAQSVRITGAENYRKIEAPAIVQRKDETFVLITKISGDKVTLTDGEQVENVTLVQLAETTTGVMSMLSCPRPIEEPDYGKHRLDDAWQKVSAWMWLPLVTGLVGWAVTYLYHHSSLSYQLLLLLSAIGFVLCLLLHRQWLGTGNAVEKLCQWISTQQRKLKWLPASQCSEAHTSFVFNRWFDLSEVGGSFFATLLLTPLLWPMRFMLWPALTLLLTTALPFTVWSLWWQIGKQKTWCPLCCGVQLLLWALAALCWRVMLTTPALAFSGDALIVVAILLLAWLALLSFVQHCITPLYTYMRDASKYRRLYTQLKGERSVIAALLHGDMRLRGQETHTLEVALSPTCPHCKRVEAQLERLLQYTDRYTVELHYLAVHEGDEALILARISEEQAAADKQWSMEHDVKGTPTIFIDGHHLPRYYDLNDLLYY